MLRIMTGFLVAMATVCVANLARAQDDFSRAGCYLGLAGTVAFPTNADYAVESETGLSADVSEGLGLHARAGCRSGWGGGEVHFEWLEGADIEADGLEGEVDGWALTLDGKVYPLWVLEEMLPPLVRRFQPFATVGFGYLTEKLTFDDPSAEMDDWDFAFRLGGGLDVYVTRNIVINVDATYVLPASNALDDMDYLSVGWGLLFRF